MSDQSRAAHALQQTSGKQIQLANGGFAVVDDEDFDSVSGFEWRRDKNGYVRRSVHPRGCVYLHQQIMPGVPLVDHKDNDKLNNRKSNLRPATKAQNAFNIAAHRDSKSRYKGVSFDKQRGLWCADISGNGKRLRLGRFKTEREVAIAYNRAALELHGEFARLNEVEESNG